MNDIDPKREREPGDEQRPTHPVDADADAGKANFDAAAQVNSEAVKAEPVETVATTPDVPAAIPSPAAINPAELGPIAPTPAAQAAVENEAPAAETPAAAVPVPQAPAVEIEPRKEAEASPAEAGSVPPAPSEPEPLRDQVKPQASSQPVPPSAPHPSQGPIIIPVSAKEALRPTPVPAPPPKLKKSRGSRSQVVVFLNFVMTVLVFLTIALGGAIYYGLSTFSEKGPTTVNSNFIVKPGWGVGDISRGLEASGLISDARVFQYVTKSYLHNRTLKAGEYEIKAGASMKEIVELMESGKSILYSVTLPEGLTVQQIFDRLRADPVLDGDLPAKMPDEGTLRPDTYKFTRGAKRSEIVAQMKAAQTKLVDDLWAKRSPDLFIKTKEQFVTLASIVEKETGKPDERTLVASVFLNRLEKKMRLQSDPTVIYGIFGGEGKPSDRPIYQSDLKKLTPYNTYVIDGLPPGPICNPGRAALEAVANPSKTNDLYFVADGTGGHVFAATLEEHNANVRKWRQVEEQQTNPTGTDAGATAPTPATQQ
ncbi:UPF0755 protein [Ensifer adhaerens]|nr:UPF0755 protein [Ensifer adhaerens]